MFVDAFMSLLVCTVEGYMDGYFIACAAQMPHLLFTGLEDYKVRGTDASPYLTVAHYTELMDTKGLVLVRGDIVFPSKLTDLQVSLSLDDN